MVSIRISYGWWIVGAYGTPGHHSQADDPYRRGLRAGIDEHTPAGRRSRRVRPEPARKLRARSGRVCRLSRA
jgi:hypothetical protein